jgi:hypothetical protein
LAAKWLHRSRIEANGRRCYICVMSCVERQSRRAAARTGGRKACTTIAFAALGDHARLPWRFFARLLASDGLLARR